MTTRPASQDYGTLTDANLARARQRIGIWQPEPNPPHNFEVSMDGCRHFAFGYGDDNPLFCSPEYGKGTRWGTLIAPPMFTYTMGEDTCP
ncbi:MAG: MaoC family dehydratase N-terminal domain-containing protein, partial [Steroidobacteraceae bacterium]